MTANHTKDYNNFSTLYTDKFLEEDAKSRDTFTRHLPSLKGKTVLDVGCGSGHDVAAYAAAGALAHGIDPSSQFVAQAKIRWPGIQITEGVAEQLPFADSSIDVYTSIYALQNADVPKAMAEAARVVRPGGTVLMLTKHPMRQFLERNKRTVIIGRVNTYQALFLGNNSVERTESNTRIIYWYVGSVIQYSTLRRRCGLSCLRQNWSAKLSMLFHP